MIYASDPAIVVRNPNIQSPMHDVMEKSSSTSSKLREEVIYTASVEADMDESHNKYETRKLLVVMKVRFQW